MDLGQRRAVVLAGSLAIVAWGGVGLYQGLHAGFSGGLYDPEYRVPEVWRGGLADRSGFKAGDRIVSVEGRPVETLGMESRWPRALAPRAGDTRRFVVERAGARITLTVEFPAPFPAAVNHRVRAALVGLSFLACGLWAFLTVPTEHARRLACIGLAVGAGTSFGLGPSLGAWNGVPGHLSTAADVLSIILLLRFFLTFPAKKAVGASRVANGLVFGAWGGLLAFLVAELIVHPALYYQTGSVVGPLMLIYVALVLAAIAHTIVRGSPVMNRSSGMYAIGAGLLVAIAGSALQPALGAGLPAWSGALWIAAIPLSMALAVRKHARRAAGGPPSPA